MKWQDNITIGFQSAFRQWRPAAIVYLIQLALALTLGMQVYEVFNASIGKSLELNKLLHGYDHTVVTDFLKVHGASLTPLIGQLRWLLPIWLFFSVFLHAGLLNGVVHTSEKKVFTFWQGASTYFFPFLGLMLVFLLLVLLWSILIWLPAFAYIGASFESLPSEKPMIWVFLFALIIWGLGLAFFFIWSLLSRLRYIHTSSSIFGGIKKAWGVFYRHKWRLWSFFVLFFLLQCLLIIAYHFIESLIPALSAGAILLLFFIQQLFIFIRILMRISLYHWVNSGVLKSLQ